MVTERMRLIGGRLVDPSQGIDDLADIVVGSGRVVEIVSGTERRRRSAAASGERLVDVEGMVIAPGFVDLHIHFPQIDVIGSPAAGLLPWLENYTFPQESRFVDEVHCSDLATFFLDELLRHGVTSALAFATSHPSSVNALMGEAQQRGLRLIAGKVLQDRHSPDGVRDQTEQSLIDTETLIEHTLALLATGLGAPPSPRKAK